MARGGLLEQIEDLGHEQVAADDRQVGIGGTGRRLLHHPMDLVGPLVLGGRALDDTVLVGLVHGHLLDGDDGLTHLVVQVDHLLAAGDLAHHQVVAEEHHEGLVADHVAGHPDGVAEAERLFLAHRDNVDEVGDVVQLLAQLFFLAVLEHRVELEVVVEMVLDGGLAGAGDQDDLLDARGHRLLDDVLDGGPVDDGEHLLGDGLGGRQEPRAQPGHRNDGLSDRFHGVFSVWLFQV